jgi:hypothetical protein
MVGGKRETGNGEPETGNEDFVEFCRFGQSWGDTIAGRQK